MEKITQSKSRIKVNVVTPTGTYGQISDSFKLGGPPQITRNTNDVKGTENTGGMASTIKKTSATPNIVTTVPAT